MCVGLIPDDDEILDSMDNNARERQKEKDKKDEHYCPIGEIKCRWFEDTVLGEICKILEFAVCNFEVCPIPSRQQKPLEKNEEKN
jgi:hypothetical protein